MSARGCRGNVYIIVKGTYTDLGYVVVSLLNQRRRRTSIKQRRNFDSSDVLATGCRFAMAVCSIHSGSLRFEYRQTVSR